MTSWLVSGVAQLLLFALLTGMSASVDVALLRERFKRLSGIALGIFMQFTVLPFAGFCTARAFDLPPVFGVALMAVTSSPGGAYSNWWCSLFNADLALSIAMTTCSTLASLVLTPLNLAIYTKAAYGTVPELDWWNMFSSIAVAMLAICAGLGISIRFPLRRQLFNAAGNVAGLALIIFSALVSSNDDPIWDKDARFYVAVAAPCLAGLVISFFLGRLAAPCISGPEAVSVTVETAYQNTGLALTIALSSFSPEDRGRAAGVPLYYSVVQVVLLPLFLTLAWRLGLTYAPRREWLHRVILEDYQPASAKPTQVAPAPSNSEDASPTDQAQAASHLDGARDCEEGAAASSNRQLARAERDSVSERAPLTPSASLASSPERASAGQSGLAPEGPWVQGS